MELYQEIIWKVLEENVFRPSPNMEKIVMSRCYQALERIRTVLSDETLDDVECFQKIEEIVCIYELLGSHGGNRHDFG